MCSPPACACAFSMHCPHCMPASARVLRHLRPRSCARCCVCGLDSVLLVFACPASRCFCCVHVTRSFACVSPSMTHPFFLSSKSVVARYPRMITTSFDLCRMEPAAAATATQPDQAPLFFLFFFVPSAYFLFLLSVLAGGVARSRRCLQALQIGRRRTAGQASED